MWIKTSKKFFKSFSLLPGYYGWEIQKSVLDLNVRGKDIYFFSFFLNLFFYFLNFKIFNSCLPSQTWTRLPPPSPQHLSGSSPCTSPKHPVSCIGHRLAIRFLHDSIHVSVPFSQIILPSPSPSESKSPLYTSVSLLLSSIQGHHCHLSKFHIYVLVYCNGVFLSGLLHSV